MPLIKLFLDICLFRQGPQDVPRSRFLLGIVAAANLLFSIVLGLFEVDFPQALIQGLAALALLLTFILVTLTVAGQRDRIEQTLTAAVGGDTLITALGLPLVIARVALPGLQNTASLLLLGLMLWEIAVFGHIIRHALNLPYLAGLGVALAYTAISLRVMMTLFPPLT